MINTNPIDQAKALAARVSIHAMVALWGNASFGFDGERWTLESPEWAFNRVKCSHTNLAMACRQWTFDSGAALAWHVMSDEEKTEARAYAMSR